LLLFLNVSFAQERDVATEFKAAQGSLLSQLRGKKANQLAAIRKIEAFSTPEAAKLLIHQGMSSSDEEVRRASFDVLFKFSSDRQVCAFLRATVGKSWKQGGPQPEIYAAIATLLASELPEVHDEALELVKESTKHPVHGRFMLIRLADELSNGRGDSAARPLIELMDLPLFKHDFAYRRAVEQALVQVRAKPAVAALIRLLASVKGEVRTDIIRYLMEVSGKQIGLEAEAWSDWWKENETTFTFPPEQNPADAGLAKRMVPPVLNLPPAGPSYYGLPLLGAKIIFIIDTSGSMAGARIFAAKRELVRAIGELPESVEFNIIAFNNQPYVWQPKLVSAGVEIKQSAMNFVNLLRTTGKTASFEALDAALRLDSEVIYFLTDGDPTVGPAISNIVHKITQLNQFRRMTIHSLGIGVGVSGNAFDNFLFTLAQQNFGMYQRVDQ